MWWCFVLWWLGCTLSVSQAATSWCASWKMKICKNEFWACEALPIDAQWRVLGSILLTWAEKRLIWVNLWPNLLQSELNSNNIDHTVCFLASIWQWNLSGCPKLTCRCSSHWNFWHRGTSHHPFFSSCSNDGNVRLKTHWGRPACFHQAESQQL